MPKNIKINLADCLGTSNKCGKADEQRIWNFQRRLEALEAKPDNDNQLLSITDNKLSITNGNEVTLPVYDDTQVRELIKENSDKVDKVSQDLTSVGNRVSNVEGSITNLNETTTNNSKEIEALKNKTDVFVSNMSFSREGDEVTLKYTRTDGIEKSVSFTDKDTKMVAYDDEPLKARVTALENKPDNDNQTLTLDGQTLSISNGNSVTIPTSTPQTLTVNGATLSISGGNSVELPIKKNELGYKAVKKYILEVDEGLKRDPLYERAYLTVNPTTNLGLLHLELLPSKDNYNYSGVLVGKLPDNAPKPVSLIEDFAVGFDLDGNLDKGSTVYIGEDGKIKGNHFKEGFRYIFNLTGYFV